jgi:hypothetical protein
MPDPDDGDRAPTDVVAHEVATFVKRTSVEILAQLSADPRRTGRAASGAPGVRALPVLQREGTCLLSPATQPYCGLAHDPVAFPVPVNPLERTPLFGPAARNGAWETSRKGSSNDRE